VKVPEGLAKQLDEAKVSDTFDWKPARK
jgi:hypothetical protein